MRLRAITGASCAVAVIAGCLMITAEPATAHSGSEPTKVRKCEDYSPFQSDGTNCHIIVVSNTQGAGSSSSQTVTVTYANGTQTTSTLTGGQSTNIETNVTQVTIHETITPKSGSQTDFGHPTP